MFQTIKSKIFLIIFFTIFVCFVVTFTLMSAFYVTNKKTRNATCDYTVAYHAEKINSIIARLSDFDKNFALKGEIFYSLTNKDHKILDNIAVKAFNASEDIAFGGGIFFEPYALQSGKKRFCSYVFNKNNKYVLDYSFENKKYDYHNQIWYTYLKDSIIKEGKFSFTKPYIDEAGTKSLMITLGAGIFKNNKFVGVATVDWMLDKIIDTLTKIKPTPNTFVLFADTKNDSILVLNYNNEPDKYTGHSLKIVGWYKDNIKNGTIFKFNSVEYISFSRQLLNNMIVVINVPTKELYYDLKKTFVGTIIFAIISIIILFISLRYMLLNNIKRPIDYILKRAKKLRDGDLDAKMDISNPKEFGIIANTFNSTIENLKEHVKNLSIANVSKKNYETELKMSRTIQSSCLNKIFPPYTNRNEIDIYASMNPTKQVGGNFYDFFFLNDKHFVFLIADVSSKGMPAALFMIQSKNFLKNALETTNNLKQAIKKANSMLCRTNETNFFVTAFIAVLNTDLGTLRYINAGHNSPLIKTKNGKYEYLSVENNMPLGKIDDIDYIEQEKTLQAGDSIFLYTDGIIKAQNNNNECYGINKLQEVLNKENFVSSKDVLKSINLDLNKFSNGMDQYDDMTMLHLTYTGKDDSNFVVQANKNYWRDLYNFLTNDMLSKSVPEEIQSKVIASSEEIFINIIKYTYGKAGNIWIKTLKQENSYKITFSDYGKKYNPLEHQDAGASSLTDKYNVGGLGMFLVKKLMSNVEYKYEHLQNILTITITF